MGIFPQGDAHIHPLQRSQKWLLGPPEETEPDPCGRVTGMLNAFAVKSGTRSLLLDHVVDKCLINETTLMQG